ncbi:Tubulin alpha-2 chain [Clonorchis sinensis]|uniref:Tubulin alpha-2 chain n=1 Tax=Clonorchis sinensis TaxID=79923 RepID=A0A419QF52_CLOSI|nr:Tubulin alpha-2 chain [Clonorchis sinensis]
MGGEIVTIHLGQAGVQISHALWELVCAEHGIYANGRKSEDAANQENLEIGRDYVFREVLKDKFVPRALLVDLEPSVVDEIRSGAYRDLWHPLQLITGKEDAASNFARGYYSQTRFEMNEVTDRLRILVEQCDNMACFKLLYSANGGTGSGLTSALCERLSDEYGKKHKFATTVYPSPGYSELMVEPYNALLHSSTNLTFCDCVIITDNEAMLNVVEDSLRMRHAGFTVPNRVIANAIATQFLSHRYKFIGQQHSHVDELLINLIPYPRIHFPMVAFAPFLGADCHPFEKYSAVELVRSVFYDTNQLLSVSAVKRAYISCALLFRGTTTPIEAINAVSAIKGDRMSRARFVDWCPTGFKIGVNFAPPVQPNTLQTISLRNNSLSMIAGNLAIRDVWTGVGRRFDQLYEKRAYVHWYVAEGMEEGEFTLAREVIQQLVEDYEAIAKDAEGAVYDRSMNHSHNQSAESMVRIAPGGKRALQRTNDVNLNQVTTLDDPNSLRTLENNEENMSLDTNQHHLDSFNGDGFRVSRLRGNFDEDGQRFDWAQRTRYQKRFDPMSRVHPSWKRRLRFPEMSHLRHPQPQPPISSQQQYNRKQATQQTSPVENFGPEKTQQSSNALSEPPFPLYGTNCSAAVFQPIRGRTVEVPLCSKRPGSQVRAQPSPSVGVGRQQKNGLSCLRPSSKTRADIDYGLTQYLREGSGIPRFSGLAYAKDMLRKVNIYPSDDDQVNHINSILSDRRTPSSANLSSCGQPFLHRVGSDYSLRSKHDMESENSDNSTVCITQSMNQLSAALVESEVISSLSNQGNSVATVGCINRAAHGGSLESIPEVRNSSDHSYLPWLASPGDQIPQISQGSDSPPQITPLKSSKGFLSQTTDPLSTTQLSPTEAQSNACYSPGHRHQKLHRGDRHRMHHCQTTGTSQHRSCSREFKADHNSSVCGSRTEFHQFSKKINEYSHPASQSTSGNLTAINKGSVEEQRSDSVCPSTTRVVSVQDTPNISLEQGPRGHAASPNSRYQMQLNSLNNWPKSSTESVTSLGGKQTTVEMKPRDSSKNTTRDQESKVTKNNSSASTGSCTHESEHHEVVQLHIPLERMEPDEEATQTKFRSTAVITVRTPANVGS